MVTKDGAPWSSQRGAGEGGKEGRRGRPRHPPSATPAVQGEHNDGQTLNASSSATDVHGRHAPQRRPGVGGATHAAAAAARDGHDEHVVVAEELPHLRRPDRPDPRAASPCRSFRTTAAPQSTRPTRAPRAPRASRRTRGPASWSGSRASPSRPPPAPRARAPAGSPRDVHHVGIGTASGDGVRRARCTVQHGRPERGGPGLGPIEAQTAGRCAASPRGPGARRLLEKSRMRSDRRALRRVQTRGGYEAEHPRGDGSLANFPAAGGSRSPGRGGDDSRRRRTLRRRAPCAARRRAGSPRRRPSAAPSGAALRHRARPRRGDQRLLSSVNALCAAGSRRRLEVMEAPSAVWKAVRACTPRAQRFWTTMEAARDSRNARRGTAPRRRVCETAGRPPQRRGAVPRQPPARRALDRSSARARRRSSINGGERGAGANATSALNASISAVCAAIQAAVNFLGGGVRQ